MRTWTVVARAIVIAHFLVAPIACFLWVYFGSNWALVFDATSPAVLQNSGLWATATFLVVFTAICGTLSFLGRPATVPFVRALILNALSLAALLVPFTNYPQVSTTAYTDHGLTPVAADQLGSFVAVVLSATLALAEIVTSAVVFVLRKRLPREGAD